METMRLGSVGWWVRHELRLVARELLLDFGPAAAFASANALLGLYLLLHAAAYIAFLYLPAAALRPGGLVDVVVACAACLLSGIRGIATAFRMVYVRKDGEMFLASPVSMKRLLLARSVALVAGSTVLPLFWLSPFANIRALLSGARYLAFYPALLAIATIVASLAALVVLQAVRRMGKERLHAVARVLVLLALLGAIALRTPAVERLLRAYAASWHVPLAAAGRVAAAFSGQPAAVFSLLAAGLACFALVPSLVAGGFSTSLARIPPARVRSAAAGPFLRGRSLRLLAKEWKQLWRDRSVLGQIAASLLLTAGAVVLLAGARPGLAGGLAGAAVVYAAGNLASDLAWLAVSGEQAPWLLASSPNPALRLLLHKAMAAFIPAGTLVVLASAWMAIAGAPHFLQVSGFGLGCCLGAVLLNVSVPTAGRRGDAVFARRNRHRLLSLLDTGCSACWAAAALLPTSLVGWKAAAALLAAAVPISLWKFRGRFSAAFG